MAVLSCTQQQPSDQAPRAEETMRSLTTFLVVAALPFQAALAQTAVKWGPAPAVFPKGAKMAVMQGDPSKSDLFTVRLDMPRGYKIAPHFHPTDEQDRKSTRLN